MDPTVTTERHGRVLLVRIDRPQKRNAIDAATTAGLDAALNLLDDDPDLWAGVLAGTPWRSRRAPLAGGFEGIRVGIDFMKGNKSMSKSTTTSR